MTDLFELRPPEPLAISTRTETERRLAIERQAVMVRKFGPGPIGRTCGDCAHLTAREYGRKYFKCTRYRVSRSAASDWRKKWAACGLFRERP